MKRILRVFYHGTSFEELQQKHIFVSIHYRNTQVLTTEMFAVGKGISPKILTEVLPLIQPLNYIMRHPPDFPTTTVKSVSYGTESLGNLGPNILELAAA